MGRTCGVTVPIVWHKSKKPRPRPGHDGSGTLDRRVSMIPKYAETEDALIVTPGALAARGAKEETDKVPTQTTAVNSKQSIPVNTMKDTVLPVAAASRRTTQPHRTDCPP